MKSPYTKLLESKTRSELITIAHIKRFLECFSGDRKFREQALDSSISLKELAEERGCYLQNIDSLRPVFDNKFYHFRELATIDTWPLTAIWDDFYKGMLSSMPYYLKAGDSAGEFKEFDIWRTKQISRTFIEVGPGARSIVHPPIAFELSDGCTVGCWFCGISADKFGGHFSLENGGDIFWREILEATKSVLGQGMSTGFCYWATEPLDHPEYDEFIKIYYDVVGTIPQTTTAIPLRNIELTKKVLKFWEKDRFVPNRFSVLTTPIMRRIHSKFTAEELLGVEMVMQGSESLGAKSIAGKARPDDNEGKEGAPQKKKRSDKMEEGTIACVTGFLVNLPKKTIRLVSPTKATEECPDGYYVFSERKFSSAEDLAITMREMILAEDDRISKGNEKISVGSNFWFESNGDKTSLRTDQSLYEMEIFSVIGPMLQSGESTPNEILKNAISAGYDPLLCIAIIRDLLNVGIIGDELRPLEAA